MTITRDVLLPVILAVIFAYFFYAVFDERQRHWWWSKRGIPLRLWQRLLLGPNLLNRFDGFGLSPIPFRVGDSVRHRREGWTGVVSEIDPETNQMRVWQGGNENAVSGCPATGPGCEFDLCN
jgi:hypothetical protein